MIAVVDAAEAAANPLSRRVTAALERGAGIATWAARVEDLDALAQRLASAGVPTTGPRRGSRRRPDGVLLEWRTLHVGDGLEPAIPFFIEWRLPPGSHPGETPATHSAGRVRLKGLRFTSPDPGALEERLRALVGGVPGLVFEAGEREEVAAVILDVNGEERLLTRA